MNTTFLSTSKDKQAAELFSEKNQEKFAVLCTFVIRGGNNRRTALNIEHISWFHQEQEVLLLPFSAFYIQSVTKSSNNSKPIEMILVEDDSESLENTDAMIIHSHERFTQLCSSNVFYMLYQMITSGNLIIFEIELLHRKDKSILIGCIMSNMTSNH